MGFGTSWVHVMPDTTPYPGEHCHPQLFASNGRPGVGGLGFISIYISLSIYLSISIRVDTYIYIYIYIHIYIYIYNI